MSLIDFVMVNLFFSDGAEYSKSEHEAEEKKEEQQEKEQEGRAQQSSPPPKKKIIIIIKNKILNLDVLVTNF